MATVVCGICLLFSVDAAGVGLLLLGAFAITHAITTISLLSVSTATDAVRMVRTCEGVKGWAVCVEEGVIGR